MGGIIAGMAASEAGKKADLPQIPSNKQEGLSSAINLNEQTPAQSSISNTANISGTPLANLGMFMNTPMVQQPQQQQKMSALDKINTYNRLLG